MQTIRAEGGVYHGAVHDEQLQPAATFVSPPHPWGALVTACIALFLIGVNTTAINTAVSAIAALRTEGLTVKALQEYHASIDVAG